MAQRPDPSSLKELQADHAEVKADAEGLAIALERMRRAAAAVLELARRHHAFDAAAPVAQAFINLHTAFTKSKVGDSYYLEWAADVLDNRIVRRRAGHKPRLETFHEVRTRASIYNIHVHFQHTFEGTQYSIHEGRQKIGHANNDRDCIVLLRKFIRKKQKP